MKIYSTIFFSFTGDLYFKIVKLCYKTPHLLKVATSLRQLLKYHMNVLFCLKLNFNALSKMLLPFLTLDLYPKKSQLTPPHF